MNMVMNMVELYDNLVSSRKILLILAEKYCHQQTHGHSSFPPTFIRDSARWMLDKVCWTYCKTVLFWFLQNFCLNFLALDMSEIRRTFDPICIPPPGWVEPDTFHDDSDNDASDVDRSFVCDRTLADGTPCLQAFPTFQALAAHKSSTKGGTHDDISPIAILAITNACPFCKNIFSSTQSARNHISRSLKEGRCSGSGSHVFFKIETPSDLRCRCCSILFDSVHQLLDHVTTHVVLQRPEVQR